MHLFCPLSDVSWAFAIRLTASACLLVASPSSSVSITFRTRYGQYTWRSGSYFLGVTHAQLINNWNLLLSKSFVNCWMYVILNIVSPIAWLEIFVWYLTDVSIVQYGGGLPWMFFMFAGACVLLDEFWGFGSDHVNFVYVESRAYLSSSLAFSVTRTSNKLDNHQSILSRSLDMSRAATRALQATVIKPAVSK